MSESIPGINTKKITEPMWVIFTDKVSESISRINTRSLSESLSIIDTGVMNESARKYTAHARNVK